MIGYVHASSKSDVPSINGTWAGKIGGSQVVACFANENYSGRASQFGAYFYLQHAKLIGLQTGDGNGDLWSEGDDKNPTGIWSVRIKDNILTGTWSSSTQTKKLPITLIRIRSITSYRSSTCNSEDGIFVPDVYKLAHSIKVMPGNIKLVDGKRYRQLTALDGAVKSVELIDSTKSAAELNANEACFTSSEFKEGLAGLGIKHQRSRPGMPWQNGRIERLFLTLKEKLDQLWVLDTVALQLALGSFRLWYNGVRVHQHLDGRTPSEAWHGIDQYKSPKSVELFEAWDGLLVGYYMRR
ncbi:MAG: integrase core domain-containing protein [Dyella sp.]|uniref:integrase core domain-containing protein n=1 Tax=Dyella sp. TaxID=1869338 RepID=UPI003F7F0FBE